MPSWQRCRDVVGVQLPLVTYGPPQSMCWSGAYVLYGEPPSTLPPHGPDGPDGPDGPLGPVGPDGPAPPGGPGGPGGPSAPVDPRFLPIALASPRLVQSLIPAIVILNA